MRVCWVVLLAAILDLATQPAKADPYRWCAEYSGGRGGGTNCYFITWQQCQATVFGVGGFCRPNPFYTGPSGNGRSSFGMQRRYYR